MVTISKYTGEFPSMTATLSRMICLIAVTSTEAWGTFACTLNVYAFYEIARLLWMFPLLVVAKLMTDDVHIGMGRLWFTSFGTKARKVGRPF